MYDSFWDWKIDNQFEVDPVIQIAGLRFNVRRKSRVADVRPRPANAPRLGSDLFSASCSRRAFRNRLIFVGGRESQAAGERRKYRTLICAVNIIISACFKPVRTTLAPHKCVHGSRVGIYKDARMGLKLVEKVNGGARSSKTRVNHPQKRCGETVSPLLSSHRSNYCSSACMAFHFSTRAALRASCVHARCEWMQGDRRGKVRWKELIRSAAPSSQIPVSTVKCVDWPWVLKDIS